MNSYTLTFDAKTGYAVPGDDEGVPNIDVSGESDFAVFHKNHGYQYRDCWPSTIGEEFGTLIEVLEKKNITPNEKWPYLVTVDNGNGGIEIFVNSLASLVALYTQLSSLVLTENREVLKEIHDIVQKMFFVQHPQHSAEDVCDDCNPREMQLARDRRERFLQEKAAREAAKAQVPRS